MPMAIRQSRCIKYQRNLKLNLLSGNHYVSKWQTLSLVFTSASLLLVGTVLIQITPGVSIAAPPKQSSPPINASNSDNQDEEGVETVDTFDPESDDTFAPASGATYQECDQISKSGLGCDDASSNVCAKYDTGIRCITTPCPSEAWKNFTNACNACQQANVLGYAEGSCVEKSTDIDE